MCSRRSVCSSIVWALNSVLGLVAGILPAGPVHYILSFCNIKKMTLLYKCVFAWAHMLGGTAVEDSSEELALSSHCLSPKDQTQVARRGMRLPCYFLSNYHLYIAFLVQSPKK